MNSTPIYFIIFFYTKIETIYTSSIFDANILF